MAHLQQQVLDAVRTLIAAGSTSAGSRVYVDRVDPAQAAQLPMIVISETEQGEDAEPATVTTLQQRTLGVVIECVVTHSTTAAADARTLGLAVEKIVAPTGGAIGALCKAGWRIVNSRLAISGEADRLVASRVQTWQFAYYVNKTTPDVVA